jgi:hypothetical protein
MARLTQWFVCSESSLSPTWKVHCASCDACCGPRLFEPLNTPFWNSVRSVRPDLYKGFNPWDRICEPEALRSLLASAGLQDIQIVAETDTQPVNSFEEWWAIILGSGYRGTVDQLSTAERERVESQNSDFMRAEQIRSVEANVLYAVGTA